MVTVELALPLGWQLIPTVPAWAGAVADAHVPRPMANSFWSAGSEFM